MQELLQIIEVHVPRRMRFSGPQRLDVTLSSGLCKALMYTVPPPSLAPADRWIVVQHEIAGSTGTAPDDVRLAFDCRWAGVGVFLTRQLLDGLHSWSKQVGVRLRSVIPLWALATGCSSARDTLIKAVLVRDDDGVVIIGRAQSGDAHASTTELLGTAEQEAAIEKEIHALGWDEKNVLRVRFGKDATVPISGGPRVWAGMWGTA